MFISSKMEKLGIAFLQRISGPKKMLIIFEKKCVL